MKKILPLFFIFLATTAVAQNKDYILSTEGIGSLKLGMPLVELEKLLGTKIKLKVIDVDPVALGETIKAKYKGINVEIELIKNQEYIAVNGISASSPLCKTTSGIGIGSTKLQIIAAYDGYNIDALPFYDSGRDENLIKSKTKSTVIVKEAAEGYAIIFTLVNKKVVSFQVLPMYDDEE